MEDIQKICSRVDKLKSDRSTWESYWQDVADYVVPRKAYITRAHSSGDKLKMETVYDATAVYSNQVLAAGLHGYLTNPSAKWFSIQMRDAALNESGEVRRWLKDVEDKIYDVLNGSNFSQQIHETYLDLGSIGTAALYEEEDEVDVVRFYARPIVEMIMVEDSRGRVIEVYRKFQLTAQQASDRWGDKAGAQVAKLIEQKKYDQKIDFLHAVFPRHKRDVSKDDALNMPYASYYIEVSKKEKISEGGYHEFPFMCPRWSQMAGEVYGYSPAMVVYADIKMLNAMEKTIIKGAQKIVDPPLIMPHDGYLMPFRTTPGGLNYRMPGTSADDKVEPLVTRANIPVGLEMANQRRESVKRGFHVDLFLTLADKKNMTATEVVQRVEEKMLILGPALGRLMSELLDPIIGRTFNILARKGVLPEIPPAIKDKEYAVDYISPLAKAQRASEINSMNGLMMMLEGLGSFNPEIVDKINFDEATDLAVDLFGVTPKILNDDDVVQAKRDQRAKQQEMQAQLAMAEQASKAAKNAGIEGKDILQQ